MVSQEQFDELRATLVNQGQFEELRLKLVAYESQQSVNQSGMQQEVNNPVLSSPPRLSLLIFSFSPCAVNSSSILCTLLATAPTATFATVYKSFNP